MIVKIYSVLDTKVGAFGTLQMSQRDESAMRTFADDVNFSDPKNAWFNHPEDFALYFLGEYDMSSGELIPAGKLKCIVTASAVKRSVSTPMEMVS